jgi:hypothetical protein
MPTAITGLDDGGPGRPAPVVSALVEFGSALHVLRDPGHHGADAWAAPAPYAFRPTPTRAHSRLGSAGTSSGESGRHCGM